jgi:hypothetical protein
MFPFMISVVPPKNDGGAFGERQSRDRLIALNTRAEENLRR